MSAKVKSMLGTIKTRLQATGYTLVSGRFVDAEHDTLPAVGFGFHPKKGIKSAGDDRRRAPTKIQQRLHLVVDAQMRVTNPADAIEELEDLHTAVHAQLFDADDRDLGGVASGGMAMTERHSFVPDPGDDVGQIQIHIEIPYVEDY